MRRKLCTNLMEAICINEGLLFLIQLTEQKLRITTNTKIINNYTATHPY